MNAETQTHIRWALMALGLVRNKLTAMGMDENDTALVNLAAAATTLASIEGVKPAVAPEREVPPGKWKVDMPDGLYTQMPGDAPGPCDLRKVIGGYVYFVTPQSGKLVALNPPRNLGVGGLDVETFSQQTPTGGEDPKA